VFVVLLCHTGCLAFRSPATITHAFVLIRESRSVWSSVELGLLYTALSLISRPLYLIRIVVFSIEIVLIYVEE